MKKTFERIKKKPGQEDDDKLVLPVDVKNPITNKGTEKEN